MRRLVLAVAVVVAAPGAAHAKVLDLYAQIEGGGAIGTGLRLAEDQQDFDFFEGARGGMYGAKVGVEFLFTDAWVEHWQLTTGDGINGTWTQFMLGTDVDFALGEAEDPKQKPKTFAELGFAFGFGMGTGQQVDPPLDNSEITDKGLIAQVSMGIDYRMNSVMSLGLVVPITYGYLYKQLPDSAVNDTSTQYSSLSVAPMVYFRFHLGK